MRIRVLAQHNLCPHTFVRMQPVTLTAKIFVNNVPEIRPVHTPFRHSLKHGGTKF